MPTPDNAGKAMSSRLLTMKFMQRAAASSPVESPKTPSEPPSKKQRLSSHYSPATPSADAQALQDVLAAEELKRTQAIERQAADKGETKWVLSTRDHDSPSLQMPMRVVNAGYSTIDSSATAKIAMDDDEEAQPFERPTMQGRRSFGKFNRAIERIQNPDLSSSSEDDDESASEDEPDVNQDDDADDDPTGTKAMIAQARREAAEKARAQRKLKRKADKADLARFASERRSKEVNLNPGRISNGGGNLPNTSNMKCFECGKEGHTKAKCPSLRTQRGKRRAPSY